MITAEVSNSISHIEDLPLPEFIKVINSLHEYELTEKLDGAQLLFGIDDNGFYTSRETKGGCRIYNESDYGMGFHETYMRSAHVLLEQSLSILRSAGLRHGDQVEAEVLYGELPNVVPYSADTNYLIFLRRTAGQVNIDRLKESLCNQSLDVTLLSPFTDDGRTIQFREETNTWKFSRAPKISNGIPNAQRAVSSSMSALIFYLKQPSGIAHLSNLQVERLPLNKRPDFCAPEDWKIIKEEIREKRDGIRKEVYENYVSVIKDILLEHLVHPQHSQFGPLPEDGGWIEGIVAKHRISGKMVKLVDKTYFGTIREFAWGVRNKLTERPRSPDSDLSLMGGLHVSMAAAIGHPELGTTQAKSYFRKAGTVTEERLTTLSTGINIDQVKTHWLSLLEKKRISLARELNKYEEEKSGYYIEHTETKFKVQRNGRTYYSPGIDKRTKEVFASLFEQIEIHMKTMDEIRTPVQLLEILVGRYLDDLI